MNMRKLGKIAAFGAIGTAVAAVAVKISQDHKSNISQPCKKSGPYVSKPIHNATEMDINDNDHKTGTCNPEFTDSYNAESRSDDENKPEPLTT